MKTLLFLPLSVLLTCLVPFSTLEESSYHKVTQEHVTFWWKLEGNALHCKVQAPTSGWCSLKLVEQARIQMAVKHGRAVTAKSTNQIEQLTGIETPYYSSFSFSLPATEFPASGTLPLHIALSSSDAWNAPAEQQIATTIDL